MPLAPPDQAQPDAGAAAGRLSAAALRQCFYVDETMASPHGYIPCLITEGQPYLEPLLGNGVAARPWYWGHDLAEARRICAEQNAALGLSGQDVRDIELSCLAASFRQPVHEDPDDRRRYDAARGRAEVPA